MEEERLAKIAADTKQANKLTNITEGELDQALVDDGIQGIARDHFNEAMFGPDDFVVLKNIFDGGKVNGFEMPKLAYTFQYSGIPFRVSPGQIFQLPGSRAYIYVKHVVSLIYRRIEGRDEMDKRTYEMTDPWVQAIVQSVQATLTPEGADKEQIHQLPDYMTADENLSKLAGTGDFEMPTQIDDADATDETIDKTPDFSPGLNPKFEYDADGNVINTDKTEEAVAQPGEGGEEAPASGTFPGAKKAPVKTPVQKNK